MRPTVATLGDRLVLALPERGMPALVASFAETALPDGNIAAVLQRAGRVNGMDEAVPGAVHLPAGGFGYFGWPAIAGHRNGRAFTFHPAGWQVSERSEKTLVLRATDAASALRIELTFRAGAVLAMSCALTNLGEDAYCLDRCMAGTVLVPGVPRHTIAFDGGWGREFHEITEATSRKLWLQENRRGRTSHDRYPAVIVESVDAAGAPLHCAVHVGWSGNHAIAIDRTDDGRTLIHGGELFEPGEAILGAGESYASPTLFAACGDEAGLAGRFHRAVREDVMRWPGGAMDPRPVTLNTWEGVYFDHRIEALKAQATAAAELGVERFVLDDGWFGRRDDDTTSLGDWQVDPRKYPSGLGPLVAHVRGLGMQFGLWFEPEMVNRRSDLYRRHPDWVLQVEGQPLLESRHQLVLDLTRREVADHLFACLDAVLREYAISYIKWDMNRDLTHPGDSAGRAATSRQTRAVHALMQRIREAHPHVEIEACASGGGRADYGVLRHTHRVWVSDCTDALERLAIQRGASRFLPPEVMGCHISASPNHQTGRRHSLAFRAIVAFFGHLGIELNPLRLSEDERTELGAWIALHKALRPVLHSPLARRIAPPVHDGRHVFGVALDDPGERAERLIVGVAQGVQTMQEQPTPLCLPLRFPDRLYTVTRLGPGRTPFVRLHPGQADVLSGRTPVAGGFIRAAGLNLPQLHPETAVLLELKTVKE
jgi:alpha-galactosidase